MNQICVKASNIGSVLASEPHTCMPKLHVPVFRYVQLADNGVHLFDVTSDRMVASYVFCGHFRLTLPQLGVLEVCV